MIDINHQYLHKKRTRFKYFVVPLLLILVTACSRTGISAQCKLAEDAHSLYSQEILANEKVISEEINRKEIRVNLDYQKCLSDPELFEGISGPGKKFSWFATCDEWYEDNLLKARYVNPKANSSSLEKMQLVVVNNPECFTPQQVVEAQFYLRN